MTPLTTMIQYYMFKKHQMATRPRRLQHQRETEHILCRSYTSIQQITQKSPFQSQQTQMTYIINHYKNI